MLKAILNGGGRNRTASHLVAKSQQMHMDMSSNNNMRPPGNPVPPPLPIRKSSRTLQNSPDHLTQSVPLVFRVLEATCQKLHSFGYNNDESSMEKRLHCRHMIQTVRRVSLEITERATDKSEIDQTYGVPVQSLPRERNHQMVLNSEEPLRSTPELEETSEPVKQKKKSNRFFGIRRRRSSSSSTDSDCSQDSEL